MKNGKVGGHYVNKETFESMLIFIGAYIIFFLPYNLTFNFDGKIFWITFFKILNDSERCVWRKKKKKNEDPIQAGL